MECRATEERLDEYIASSLPAEEMEEISRHLGGCANCSLLSKELQTLQSMWDCYPVLEPDESLVDRILLRTSGRPRTRSLQERLQSILKYSLLNPRFAAGAVLATAFVLVSCGLLLPRIAEQYSELSLKSAASFMDRSVHRLYGEALKINEARSEWQARFTFYKNTTWNKLRSVVERIEAPVERPSELEERIPPDNERSKLGDDWSVAAIRKSRTGSNTGDEV